MEKCITRLKSMFNNINMYKMSFEYFNDPFPFLIVRDYYNDEDNALFLKELLTIKPRLLDGEYTGSAVGRDGEKKKNKGIFLYGPECPNNKILNMLENKLEDVKLKTINKHFIFNYLRIHSVSSTLINYYENGDMYNTHTDESVLTAIYYTWEEPKAFTGGDLYFDDYKVPITNNCLLVFPSCMPHRVSKLENGSGRWAVSQFIMKRLGSVFKKDVYTYTRILSESDYTYIYNFIENGNWSFKGKSGEASVHKRFWWMNLNDEKVFNYTMLKKIESITGRKFKLERVYANGQTYGLDGSWHIDDPGDDSWTFILYLNSNMNLAWGGETCFKLQDEIFTVNPCVNTGVLFKSNIPHRGKAPARDVYDLRITVAWKLKEISI